MPITDNVDATLESLISKSLNAGVDLEFLERSLRAQLTRVETAQAEASITSSAPKGGGGATRKGGGGGPAELHEFHKDMSLSLEE